MAALTCWLAWSGPALLITLALLPLTRGGRAFAPGLALRTAGSERGLLKATARDLAALPGGRGGRIGIDASGDAARSLRAAAVVLSAAGQGVRIQGAGLESSPRAGRPWQPCAGETDMQPGVRYRIGGLYLRLE